MSLGKPASADVTDLKSRAATTVVAKDTTLTGEIRGSRSVRIEGQLKGSLEVTAPVDIAEGAVVEGTIHASVVRVAGQVIGDVHGTTLVELLASASVKGDLHTPALHVLEGASLDGRVQMQQDTRPADLGRPTSKDK